jgi:hypothetical protein
MFNGFIVLFLVVMLYLVLIAVSTLRITVLNTCMSLIEDKDYWLNLTWPAAPNLDDYRIFEAHCTGRVLLLGSTRLLLPLCTEAWDVVPRYEDAKIKNRDWFSLDQHWDTVITDGSIAIGREFTERLLPIVLKNCDTFIARAFLNPNWPTRYANYFPQAHELEPMPEEIPISEVYTFYLWKRNRQS